jgi:hypothetical protein
MAAPPLRQLAKVPGSHKNVGMTTGWTRATAVADEMVEGARAVVIGRKCPSGSLRDVEVTTIFYYGAVEIDTRHLTIWVLLEGAPPGELPTWWSPESSAPGSSDAECDSWLRGLATEIRSLLNAVDWPDGSHATVLFDSDERVREGGGFFYFK